MKYHEIVVYIYDIFTIFTFLNQVFMLFMFEDFLYIYIHGLQSIALMQYTEIPKGEGKFRLNQTHNTLCAQSLNMEFKLKLVL